MNWSKEWPSPNAATIPAMQELNKIVFINPNEDLISKTIVDNTKETVTIQEIYRVRNNKVPTHDPYSNPDAHIYYECSCGAILDPGTKSFAALNNAAMVSGWKVRFGYEHYVPYCVKCGEGVE